MAGLLGDALSLRLRYMSMISLTAGRASILTNAIASILKKNGFWPKLVLMWACGRFIPIDGYTLAFLRSRNALPVVRLVVARGSIRNICNKVTLLTQEEPVLGEECTPGHEIDPTTNNISRSELRGVALPLHLTAIRLPIVSMIPPTFWLPAWEPL